MSKRCILPLREILCAEKLRHVGWCTLPEMPRTAAKTACRRLTHYFGSMEIVCVLTALRIASFPIYRYMTLLYDVLSGHYGVACQMGHNSRYE